MTPTLHQNLKRKSPRKAIQKVLTPKTRTQTKTLLETLVEMAIGTTTPTMMLKAPKTKALKPKTLRTRGTPTAKPQKMN